VKQLEGTCSVTLEDEVPMTLASGSICVFAPGKTAIVKREEGSVGLVIRMDPKPSQTRKRLASDDVATATDETATAGDSSPAKTDNKKAKEGEEE
jgi:hypothetical protein